MPSKDFHRQFFVSCIQSAQCRILALRVQQVSQIVKKSRCHQRIRRAAALNERRRLQSVFEHRHRLVKISGAATEGQQFKHLID
jgi:hypothetical protein